MENIVIFVVEYKVNEIVLTSTGDAKESVFVSDL